jgi:hypothetical protein
MKPILVTCFAVATLLLFASSAAPQHSGAGMSPEALVADLYKQHQAHHSPFFQTRSRALVNKYFARSLGDLIWHDAVTSKGEVGAFDFDPLFNAQDTEIKHFQVGEPQFPKGEALVTVSFENFGKPERIVYVLISEAGAWKIKDIKYQNGFTLSGVLAPHRRRR